MSACRQRKEFGVGPAKSGQQIELGTQFVTQFGT
jgi:hypothetical protein